MDEEFQDILDGIEAYYKIAYYHSETAYDKFIDAAYWIQHEYFPSAATALSSAAYYNKLSIQAAITLYEIIPTTAFYMIEGLTWLGERGVTWKSIVEAWVKDDFEGRSWTIGVIDRMRQIMWNEPFDLTWAARPEEKEVE